MKKFILLFSLAICITGYAEENCAQMSSPTLLNECLSLNTVVLQSQTNLVNTFTAGLQQQTHNNNTRSVTTEKTAPIYNQPTTTPNIQPTLKQPPSPPATNSNQTYRPKIHY